jgi:hypothetical protein
LREGGGTEEEEEENGDLSNQQLVTDVELEPLNPLPLPSPFNILKKKNPDPPSHSTMKKKNFKKKPLTPCP